jgi:hypothetical protein
MGTVQVGLQFFEDAYFLGGTSGVHGYGMGTVWVRYMGTVWVRYINLFYTVFDVVFRLHLELFLRVFYMVSTKNSFKSLCSL